MKILVFVVTLVTSITTWAENILSPEAYPEEICLAKNIYFEARSSNFADKVATADVVLNRVKHNSYPNTICGVVKQAKMSRWWKDHHNKDVPIRNKCQFSWYCDGKSDVPRERDAWVEAQRIAYIMIHTNNFVGITQGATHYHAEYVNPRWAKHLELIGTIGYHIYYRQN